MIRKLVYWTKCVLNAFKKRIWREDDYMTLKSTLKATFFGYIHAYQEYMSWREWLRFRKQYERRKNLQKSV